MIHCQKLVIFLKLDLYLNCFTWLTWKYWLKDLLLLGGHTVYCREHVELHGLTLFSMWNWNFDTKKQYFWKLTLRTHCDYMKKLNETNFNCPWDGRMTGSSWQMQDFCTAAAPDDVFNLLVWSDRLKYNSSHIQKLSVCLYLIIGRYGGEPGGRITPTSFCSETSFVSYCVRICWLHIVINC